MKIELRYFTGTGNSWRVLDTCKNVFSGNNHLTNISPIKTGEKLPSDSDIIGFCFPVYAFGLPRICTRYLKQLQRFSKPQKVFVIITAGKKDESGFSVKESVDILRKKNCQIIYTAVVEMPINWTTFMNPPSREEARIIIENGVKQACETGNDIIRDIRKYHSFNIPENYSHWGLYKEYYLFKYLGIQNSWRTFKVYESCNACGICAKICPTNSIKIKSDKPVWSSSCEQCMRCVNFCPNESIYQTMGGGTVGRNRYHEPNFKPII